eukprot:TRINITY_DN22940_c0_g1_i1.p1 TRINITY_DN22940_c0_g1~~TRINITY_DN22940_c0_g1_i1.p1  ORF type:complete len:273 (-),score=46.08 TRINITY_DN22940_c0_g1_i1:288-1106(-)
MPTRAAAASVVVAAIVHQCIYADAYLRGTASEAQGAAMAPALKEIDKIAVPMALDPPAGLHCSPQQQPCGRSAVSPFAAVAAGGPTRWPMFSTGGDTVCCADDEFCKAQVSLGAYTQTACAKVCTAETCGPHGACNPKWMTSTSAQFIDPHRVSGFECHCAPGYGGEFCQWDADCVELDSTTEAFSGSSMSDDNRYPMGNPRFHRASSTSSSSADPRKVKCNGHGACVPKGGGGRGFKCACEAGYLGDYCFHEVTSASSSYSPSSSATTTGP